MIAATDWKETVAEGEAERLESLAEELRALQRRRTRGGRPLRALHAKGQAGLEVELTVLGDLPDAARVGIFASPGRYRGYARFSNGSGAVQPDAKPDVRGVAIKLTGVPGLKLIPGLEQAPTQDFLLIRTPAAPFRSPDEFVALVRAAENPALLLPRLVRDLGLGRTLQLLPRLAKGLGAPIMSLATTRYFSALPIQWGKHAVHYAIEPHAVATATVRVSGPSPDFLGEELATRLRREPVSYDFRVQFYVDATRTPIEDASVEWREADAPFLTVARLVLPQQDPASPRGRRLAEFVERLSFDPWHAPEEFRPLGAMMRARKHAYRLSTQERGAAGEPDGSQRFGQD